MVLSLFSLDPFTSYLTGRWPRFPNNFVHAKSQKFREYLQRPVLFSFRTLFPGTFSSVLERTRAPIVYEKIFLYGWLISHCGALPLAAITFFSLHNLHRHSHSLQVIEYLIVLRVGVLGMSAVSLWWHYYIVIRGRIF